MEMPPMPKFDDFRDEDGIVTMTAHAAYNSALAAWERVAKSCAERTQFTAISKNADERYIDFVCDGPPGPEPGRFVELESPEGIGVSLGTWVRRNDGYWALRIPLPVLVKA